MKHTGLLRKCCWVKSDCKGYWSSSVLLAQDTIGSCLQGNGEGNGCLQGNGEWRIEMGIDACKAMENRDGKGSLQGMDTGKHYLREKGDRIQSGPYNL